MSRRKKLSRDQKRKQKLARRADREPNLPQPYQGNKYKSEQFVDALMAAETGIYESYVITDRQLTDHDVAQSLQFLILELRGEKPAPLSGHQIGLADGSGGDLVGARIKQHWAELFDSRPRHSNSDLAGILRTILGSIKVWSRPAADSRGYLHYLEGFMGKLGVRVEVLESAEDAEGAGATDDDEESAPKAEALRTLGEAWLADRQTMAYREFRAEAEALLKEERAGLVIEVCQELLGQTSDPNAVQEITAIIQEAWKQEPPEPQRSPFKKWLGKMAPRWLRPLPRG